MIKLRKAVPADAEQIFTMLQASAREQGFPDEVVVTVEDLRSDGFGPRPRFEVLMAELDGRPAGMALYFFTYSTWVSRLGLYLEDLYILPEDRRHGVGRALLRHLGHIAREQGCRRFQWVVHRENAKAIALYKALGAQTLDEWALMSIKGKDLDAL